MYHLLSLDPCLTTLWFVTQFVFGPRDDLRGVVRLQASSKIQDEESVHQRPLAHPPTPTKHPTDIVGATAVPRVAQIDWPRYQGNGDFNSGDNYGIFGFPTTCVSSERTSTLGEHKRKRSSELLTH